MEKRSKMIVTARFFYRFLIVFRSFFAYILCQGKICDILIEANVQNKYLKKTFYSFLLCQILNLKINIGKKRAKNDPTESTSLL